MIYLLDENEIVVKALRRVLTVSGFRSIRGASTWEEIRPQLIRSSASAVAGNRDALVLEIDLPDASGLDVCRILRICNPTLPLILFTEAPERVPPGLVDAVVPKDRTCLAVLEVLKGILQPVRPL